MLFRSEDIYHNGWTLSSLYTWKKSIAKNLKTFTLCSQLVAVASTDVT